MLMMLLLLMADINDASYVIVANPGASAASYALTKAAKVPALLISLAAELAGGESKEDGVC